MQRRTFLGSLIALATLGRLPKAKTALPTRPSCWERNTEAHVLNLSGTDNVPTWTCVVYFGCEGGPMKKYLAEGGPTYKGAPLKFVERFEPC